MGGDFARVFEEGGLVEVLAILQARVSSTRLPGKVLEPILGEPMIVRQVERVGRARTLDHLVVATSVDVSDDPLVRVCEQHGIDVCRGPLEDVLSRFRECAARFSPAHIVRLTGDCPLADPELIDRLVLFHVEGGYDYSSTALQPTFPDGLDAEVFTSATLESTWHSATLSSQREHVTSYIYTHGERFRLGSLKSDVDRSALRWSVDEPRDLKMVREVYSRLYAGNPRFGYSDVLSLLDEHPEIAEINSGIARNEGYAKSLREDELSRPDDKER